MMHMTSAVEALASAMFWKAMSNVVKSTTAVKMGIISRVGRPNCDGLHMKTGMSSAMVQMADQNEYAVG